MGQRSHKSGASSKYGVYLRPYRKNIGETEITGNNIHHLDSSTSTGTHYGMYIYAYYATGSSCNISDNIVLQTTGMGSIYGIYLYAYRNTINGAVILDNNDVNFVTVSSKDKLDFPPAALSCPPPSK